MIPIVIGALGGLEVKEENVRKLEITIDSESVTPRNTANTTEGTTGAWSEDSEREKAVQYIKVTRL